MLSQSLNKDDNTTKPLIASYTNAKHKEIIKNFIKIGEVAIKENYQDNFISFGASPWPFMVDKANRYLVDNEIRSDKIFPTKDYLKTTGNWFTKLFK